MSDTPNDITAQLEEQRLQREQHHANVERVKSLLRKADKRRKTDSGSKQKWDSVLENLEMSLDEARAHRAACDAEITHLEHELRDHPMDAPSPTSTDSDSGDLDEMDQLPALGDNSLSVAKKVMGMPMEEIGQLPMEEAAQLYGEIAEENADTASPQVERLMGRIELANQTAAEDTKTEDAPQLKERTPAALRVAVDTICNSRLDDMSAEEIRLTIATHNLLSRRITSSPRDERLKRILGAAVNILARRQAKKSKSSFTWNP